MFNIEKNNFQDIYTALINEVQEKGQHVNVRGLKTKELIFTSLTLTDINKHTLDFSKTNAHSEQNKYDNYREDEIKWYESGLLNYTDAPSKKIWPDIADATGKIQSNYGYLILHKLNQYTSTTETPFNLTLSLLKRDKFTRQAILHYNLPEHYINQRDIPCTISTQILIRDNLIHFIVFQRSCDLRHGLIYDLPWHCHLMTKYVDELKSTYQGISTGNLSITFGSLHIYENDSDNKFFDDFTTIRE